jgi:hypothetical protein
MSAPDIGAVLVMVVLSSVRLVMSAISVVNIMLASVTERPRAN